MLTTTRGISVEWQNGVVKDGTPNGAFIEDCIDAAIKRLSFYNDNGMSCRENSLAITHLEIARNFLYQEKDMIDSKD